MRGNCRATREGANLVCQTVQENDNLLRTDYVRSVFNSMVESELGYAINGALGNRQRDYYATVAVTLVTPDMASLDVDSLELKYTMTGSEPLRPLCEAMVAAATGTELADKVPVTTYVVEFGDNQRALVGVHSEELDEDVRLWVAEGYLGFRLRQVLNVLADNARLKPSADDAKSQPTTDTAVTEA
jgi:hypothetical protein